jgi:NCS2 family nucleobase:cation symporter-2
MAKKPAHLIYGVDDKPPGPVLLLLSVQHSFLMSSTLVLPVVMVTETGGTLGQVGAVVAMTMIACGIGTILQAMRCGILGSGFLCPNLCGPNFFTSSMEAAWLGGLPLVRGMTIAAGLFEAAFSRVVHRLKFLFPPEITGLVVLMVALGLIPLAISKFLGINFEGEPIRGSNLLVATLTLFLMVAINLWGHPKLKMYSVLIGMAFGYLLSTITGQITAGQFHSFLEARWLALPYYEGMFDITFRWSLLPAFLIVSITGALKSFGNLIMAEIVNDEEWKEPDMKRIGNGLFADSLSVTASGILGGMASDTSASNVALSDASKATSRWIGYGAGTLFILLGFSPKIGLIFSIMPQPVMGGILVFVTCFMIMSGLKIILGTGVDVRKTFVIGVPLMFGLSLDILPSLYAGVHPVLRPLFDSSLTLCTVLSVLLNQILRLWDFLKK